MEMEDIIEEGVRLPPLEHGDKNEKLHRKCVELAQEEIKRAKNFLARHTEHLSIHAI